MQLDSSAYHFGVPFAAKAIKCNAAAIRNFIFSVQNAINIMYRWTGPSTGNWEEKTIAMKCACSVAAIRVHSPKTNGLYTARDERDQQKVLRVPSSFFGFLNFQSIVVSYFDSNITTIRIRRFQFFGECDQNDWRERREDENRKLQAASRGTGDRAMRLYTGTRQISHLTREISFDDVGYSMWLLRANVERVPSRQWCVCKVCSALYRVKAKVECIYVSRCIVFEYKNTGVCTVVLSAEMENKRRTL